MASDRDFRAGGLGPWPRSLTPDARGPRGLSQESATTLARHRCGRGPATTGSGATTGIAVTARGTGGRISALPGAAQQAGHLVVFGSTGPRGPAKPGTTRWNTTSAYRGWRIGWRLTSGPGCW